jgi:hypothetical protein
MIVRLTNEEKGEGTIEDGLRERLVKGGRDVMRRMFGREVAAERLRAIMQDLGVLSKTPQTSREVGAFVCPYLSEYGRARETVFRESGYWRSEIVKWIGEDGKVTEREVTFPLYPRLPFDQPFLTVG